MLEQGRRFDALGPNTQVKFPATVAGLAAIEEATFLGISINATVSFTVAQALAVGQAVDRGLTRRAAAGFDVSNITPVCTLMIGQSRRVLSGERLPDKVARRGLPTSAPLDGARWRRCDIRRTPQAMRRC
jgi:hypothetical protein